VTDQVDLSIVVPCHNEEGNLPRLLEAIATACVPTGKSYEVVITDDCSTDGSWALLQKLVVQHPELVIQQLERNSGESAASWMGMRRSRGQVILTMDADLQNDPCEIPRFLAALETADCVSGTRVAERSLGDSPAKVIASRLANAIRNWFTGEKVSDAGCTYRAFRRECVADIKYFRGMHRFLPTLMKIEGWRLSDIPISHRERHAGTSHYGNWGRLIETIPDMLAVRWMKSRMHPVRLSSKSNP